MPGCLQSSILFLLIVSSGPKAQKTEPQAGPSGTHFRGADQHNFAILLSGSGLECFWHFAHQTGQFYLTYIVQWVSGISADRIVHVTVLSPDGLQLASKAEARGQINFQTQETGFYQICFGNYMNRFASIQVYSDFGVYYEGPISQEEEEEITKELNSTISSIQASVDKLKTNVVHMWRFYNYGRMKRATDHFLLVSNSNYVSWWSAAQSVVIFTTGYLQLFIIKRLFHTQTNKPRC